MSDVFHIILSEDDKRLFRHEMHIEAELEATRLVLKEGRRFYILRAITVVEPPAVKVRKLGEW